MTFSDPSYAIPVLKMLSSKDKEDVKLKSSKLCQSSGYRPFTNYIKQLYIEAKKPFRDNKTDHDASSLEELQKKIDHGTIGLNNVKNVKRALEVNELELFDIGDPEVIAKACA